MNRWDNLYDKSVHVNTASKSNNFVDKWSISIFTCKKVSQLIYFDMLTSSVVATGCVIYFYMSNKIITITYFIVVARLWKSVSVVFFNSVVWFLLTLALMPLKLYSDMDSIKYAICCFVEN